jgi:ribosome maturation factor RimP
MINNELEELVAPEIETLGFECVKCEVVGSSRNPVVRLYIDKPGGVTIKDCSLASRAVGLLLDKEDPFAGKYLLEVSSPGSNRPLTTERHFQRFEGQPARVQIVKAGEGKITYTGQLRSCINGLLTLDTDEGAITVELSKIKKAYLIDQEYKIDKKKTKRPRREKRANKREDDQR